MRNLANAVGCFALTGIAPRPAGDETLNTHSRARFAQHQLHLTNAHIYMALDSVCTMVRFARFFHNYFCRPYGANGWWAPFNRGSAYGCTPAYSHTPLTGLRGRGRAVRARPDPTIVSGGLGGLGGLGLDG